jgi:hypothetical protein
LLFHRRRAVTGEREKGRRSTYRRRREKELYGFSESNKGAPLLSFSCLNVSLSPLLL